MCVITKKLGLSNIDVNFAWAFGQDSLKPVYSASFKKLLCITLDFVYKNFPTVPFHPTKIS